MKYFNDKLSERYKYFLLYEGGKWYFDWIFCNLNQHLNTIICEMIHLEM